MKHLKDDPRLITRKSLIISTAMVLIALLSATVLSSFFSSTSTYEGMFQKLDEKRTTVLALTAASATASAALTLIPDDTCTPIAEQLAEISKSFTFVVAALLLEKYLLTIVGFSFFSILVPICCALVLTSQFLDSSQPAKHVLRHASLKLMAFGLVLLLATPASVFITTKIDETHKDSIDQTVTTAEQMSEILQAESSNADTRPEAQNPLEYLQQRVEDLQAAADSASQSASKALEWVKNLLGSFVEALAVMIVTSIVIPVLVPVIIYLAFKVLMDQQTIVVQQDVARRSLPPSQKR